MLTPNLDRIAHEGIRADRFYTAAPVCTPSRYVWMTGHYPERCPADSLAHDQVAGEPTNIFFNTTFDPALEPGIATCLRDAGYVCGFTGKWHTGGVTIDRRRYDPDADPADPAVSRMLQEDYARMQAHVHRCGFAYAEGICWGNTDSRPLKALRSHNLWQTAACALDFLDQHGEGNEPFYLNIATTTLHGPNHVASLYGNPRVSEAGYLDEDLTDVLPSRQSIMARLERAGLPRDHTNVGALWHDDLVGRVLAKLDELGIAENTIIIHSADHGCGRLGKFSLHEGGCHIPFALRWPARVAPGRRTNRLMSNVDLLPTLVAVAGGAIPATAKIDGRNRLPALIGEPELPTSDDEAVFLQFAYSRALVTPRWKLILRRPPERLIAKMRTGQERYPLSVDGRFHPVNSAIALRHYPHYFDTDQLYDLAHDPGEVANLAWHPAHANRVATLRERLKAVTDTLPGPFPVDTPDPWLNSAEHAELCTRFRETYDLYTLDWYREGG